MRKGHDFRDYICPDSIEKHSDYLMLGKKYARVIYLKDYASFSDIATSEEFTDYLGIPRKENQDGGEQVDDQ